MSPTQSTPPPMTDLLDAITQALLAERELEAQAHLSRSAEAQRAEAQQLVALIARLREALVEQTPEEAFRRKLKQDLVGVDYNVITRLRYLPARVQIAAGVTLLAGGVMLLTRRRGDEGASAAPETAGVAPS